MFQKGETVNKLTSFWNFIVIIKNEIFKIMVNISTYYDYHTFITKV